MKLKISGIQLARRVSLGFFLAFATTASILHQKLQNKPNIDSFCPFGGLEAVYKFVAGGELLKKLEISNIFLFVSIVLLAIALGRFFCGWICAFGTLQGVFGWIGRKVFKKRFEVPRKLDAALRYLKYLVLVLILYGTWKAGTLIVRPYDPWAAYGHLSAGFAEIWGEFAVGLVILVASLMLSMLYERAFCKYVCPLGAFNAILSRIPLFRIKREAASCISCSKCDKACPMNIEVMKADSIDSPECIACLECVSSCPTNKGTLKPFLAGKKIALAAVAALGLAIYLSPVAAGWITNTIRFRAATLSELSEAGALKVEDIKGSSTWGQVAESFGVPVSVLQMVGHFRVFLLNGRQRVEECHRAVRFRRGREVERGVRQVKSPFGESDSVEGRGAAFHDRYGVRVGKSRVFAGRNDHPPENEGRVFSCRDHAREPVESRVRVPSPKRLDEGADYVVVIVSVPVVQDDLFLDAFFCALFVYQNYRAVCGRPGGNRGFHREFQGVQKAPRVAGGGINKMFEGSVLERDLPPAVPALCVREAGEGGFHKVFTLERLELEHPASADQRLVHFEKGIFRGGSDQDDRAVLHPGQEGVLLGAVPSVHLVYKENRPPAVEPFLVFGRGDGVAYLLNAGEHRVQGDEIAFCMVRDNPGKRCFTGPGRSVENDRGELIRLNGAAEEAAGADYMILADIFFKISGAHACGQRLMRSCLRP